MRLVKPKQIAGIPDFEYMDAVPEQSKSGAVDVFTDLLAFTSQPLKNNGIYRIGYSFYHRASKKNKEARYRLQLDAVDIDEEYMHKYALKETTTYSSFSGFAYVVGDGASVSVALQYALGDSGFTVTVKNVKIEIWRVS